MARTILEIKDISLSFGLRQIVSIDQLEIHDGERIGLVGENGAGKTTMLKLIAGEIAPDTGSIRALCPVSYLRQMGDIEDAQVSDGQLKSEFSVQEARDGLSGGEKTRRRIADALSKRGHLLLCDEPTTDLDSEGIQMLEKKLLEYNGAILLVSHDRAMLNAVCTSILHLEDSHVTLYPGNYDAYLAEREKRRAYRQFEYEQYRTEQAHLMRAIQGTYEHAQQVGKLPTRMGNSEARLHKRSTTETQEKLHKTRKALESRLNRLEEKEQPREDPDIRMALGSHTPIVSKCAVEVRGMTVRFGSNVLLENASARFPTGKRTAITGKNGAGKTTLIRRIVAGHDPRIRVSPGVKIGLFDQDHAEALDMDKSALENVMRESVYDESLVRTVLARLHMRRDDVFKCCGVLSGGEQAKVSLARLFVSDVNVLILDEPTNHIDIFTLEALQDVLSGYAGTLIVVSHDRAFVSAVAQRMVFVEDRKLISFEGTLEEYEKSRSVDRSAENTKIQIATLEMRLATLAMRLSAPKKGDDPLKLNEEYMNLAREIRALKNA